MPVDVVERPRDRKTPRPLVSNPLRRLPVQQVHSGPPVSLTRRLALTARARRAWSARVPGARARGARPSSALTCTRRSHRSRAPSSRRPPARAPTCPREGPTPNFGGGAARHCFIFFGDTEWAGRGVAPPPREVGRAGLWGGPLWPLFDSRPRSVGTGGAPIRRTAKFRPRPPSRANGRRVAARRVDLPGVDVLGKCTSSVLLHLVISDLGARPPGSRIKRSQGGPPHKPAGPLRRVSPKR